MKSHASRIGLVSLALGLVAPFHTRAQEGAPVPYEERKGVVCDSPDQLRRYLELFDKYESLYHEPGDRLALRTVNEEFPSPNQRTPSCTVAKMAFLRGDVVGTARTRLLDYDIVKILMIGFISDQGFISIPPATQFALFENKDRHGA